jgi:DNA-binding NarL/FixJ family response regulator
MMSALIVARSALAAEAVRRTLHFAPACRVKGWIDGARDCSAPLRGIDVDLVVFELGEDQELILARLRECRACLPEAKLVLLASAMGEERLAQAAAAGLDAAITRSLSSASVGTLIREIAAGNVYHVLREPPRPRAVPGQVEGLTVRELEILRLVAGGLPNSRIATTLWITEQTVKFHLSNVYRKLGLANRTQAAHYAHVHGLLDGTSAPPAPALSVVAA